MDHKNIINLLPCFVAGLFILFPGLSVDARATKNSGTDQEIMGKALPPIDQMPPKVFDTASFGLG